MNPLPITTTTVALLRLPIPADRLGSLINTLIDCYGDRISMQEEPKGWLQFNLPTK